MVLLFKKVFLTLFNDKKFMKTQTLIKLFFTIYNHENVVTRVSAERAISVVFKSPRNQKHVEVSVAQPSFNLPFTSPIVYQLENYLTIAKKKTFRLTYKSFLLVFDYKIRLSFDFVSGETNEVVT